MTTSTHKKYALLETPDFTKSESGTPLTSYLRLGAVPDQTKVADLAAMLRCTQAQGATVAALGAGEDLAARVTSFVDDPRDKCDPPRLDTGAPADATVAPPAELPLEVLQKSLEEEQSRYGALSTILTSVESAPAGWLTAMFEQWKTEKADVERLQNELDAMIASVSAQGANDADPFVPPAYSAPGYQDGAAPGSYAAYVANADRQTQSARLHSLGGVRDHTDGNRITTTRGDKLEIVEGNYRMVVLGRHDWPKDPNGNDVLPGWDISGGHTNESDVSAVDPPNATPKVGLAPSKGKFWKKRWNGNWYDVDEQVKADTRTITAGDTESTAHGHYVKSTTGSEDAPPWHHPNDCPGGVCRMNPKIISQTWAEHIQSFTGSAAEPVPHMSDTTHAVTMTSRTHATTQTDHVTAQTMNSSTQVGSMATSTVAETITSNTTASSVSDRTEASTVTTTTMAGLKADATMGNSSSTTVGMTNDIFLGAKASVNLSASMSISVAASADLFLGAKTSTTLGMSVKIDLLDSTKVNTVENTTALGAITRLSLLRKTTTANCVFP